MINIYNIDCLEAMSKMEDNTYDLAIVDPPYGIDVANDSRVGKFFQVNNRKKGTVVKARDYKKSDWDKTPPEIAYFKELKRVSKNQIIWGANHFCNLFIASSSSWIVWDKENGKSNLADAELAYTSFNKAIRIYKFRWHGMIQGDMKNKEDRIHPTQKPVKLYEWILMNYAKEGDKILDTHLGSGSSAIAAHNLGYDFTGYELDNEYFKDTKKRIDNHTAQLRIL